MAGCVLVGVQITARAQWIMSTIEVGILVVFAIVAIIRAATGTHAGPSFSWDWLTFAHFSGPGAFIAAALVAAFYYWGWDVASNLNEETKDGHKNAGLGGIIGVIIVFAALRGLHHRHARDAPREDDRSEQRQRARRCSARSSGPVSAVTSW